MIPPNLYHLDQEDIHIHIRDEAPAPSIANMKHIEPDNPFPFPASLVFLKLLMELTPMEVLHAT